MAEAPDPKTFASWEDAFRYPVAAVQQMERQLRGDINTNRERLRSLVGASYRDLLGTAESIIEMNTQMKDIEVYLGNMSSKCNTRLLEKKASNLSSWDKNTSIGGMLMSVHRSDIPRLIPHIPDSDRYAFASQLAVLRSCPDVISRLLKEAASVLLAAKVDRIMKKVDQSGDLLVDAMCAFALATSSSPTDVLRHYHHVRLEAIREREQGHGIKSSISRSLKMYVNTLKSTRAVIPGQLSQALRALKSAAMLEKADMLNLIELNLEFYEKNLGDEIRKFTPYIRLENLQSSDLENLLQKWAQQAFSSLLEHVRANLKEIDDSHQLMVLRTETFQLWFSNQQYVTGIASTEVVDELRDVFNAQWFSIVRRQAASLAQLSSTVHEIFQNWQDSVLDDDLSLWAPSMISQETANGAKHFREALMTRLQGRSGELNLAVNQYTRWTMNINAIDDSIRTASGTKWADDLNDIDDDDDILNDKQQLLSEEDPRTIRLELSESVKAAFNDLQESLKSAADDDLGEQDRGRKAVFLLRLWREIRQHLPKSHPNVSLGLDAIGSLHRLITRVAADAPLERGKVRARKTYSKSRVPGRPLWEGDPALPRLPSPWAFRLLRELSCSMADMGSDVWSRQSSAIMKKHLRESLAAIFQELNHTEPHIPSPPNESDDNDQPTDQESTSQNPQIEPVANGSQHLPRAQSNSPPLQNGDAHPSPPSNNPSSSSQQETAIQRLFDFLYLMNATAPTMTTETQMPQDHHDPCLPRELQDSAAELDLSAESLTRMQRAAEEYWARTALLFGLLA
ncbi:MAG: hypothetical protein Q9191_003272 [Dirinaria sp. TL-2023a]